MKTAHRVLVLSVMVIVGAYAHAAPRFAGPVPGPLPQPPAVLVAN